MKQVLPEPTVQRFETRDRINTTPPSGPVNRREVEFLPSTDADSTPRKPKFEIYENDVEEEVSDLGRKNFVELAVRI